MVATIKLIEKNITKKMEKIAETRMAVYIYIYIVYCHLENKKEKMNRNKNKGRTIPREQVIGLPLGAFAEKVKHNHTRGEPWK